MARRGNDRERERDRGDRGRDRDRDRDRRDGREPEGSDNTFESRLSAVEDRLQATAVLANSTAFKVGNESSKRALVFFVQGELKAKLEREWGVWQRNAELPAAQRPKERPLPWKIQAYQAFVEYVETAVRSAPRGSGGEEATRLLLPTSPAVEAIQHGAAQEDRAWPMVLVFRNSETAQAAQEIWLQACLKPFLGKDKDLGVRPARYMPAGAHRRVQEFVPKGKGVGKGKGKNRSPKRESEGPERGDLQRRRL